MDTILNQKTSSSAVIVIFGATGDLAKRKLFPAIYSLYRSGLLSDQFAVVGVARRKRTPEAFREEIYESARQFARFNPEQDDNWDSFVEHFAYYSLDSASLEGFAGLKSLTEQLDEQFHTGGNRIFYLAMAPESFGPATINLKNSGMKDGPGWKRLMIEKPFGRDVATSEALNKQIQEAFSEDEIFRIDHYLGKEMVQNIEVIRFANALFEPLWNNRHIANIQITSSETVGVEERAAYYDKSGALRDMVQNHMLQMLTMIAMEPPSSLEMEAIRDEKVKVLKSLRQFGPEEVAQHVVRGQYSAGTFNGKEAPGYLSEPGVNPESRTETFVAARLFIDNFRWSGVPFYIRTGKRMGAKSTEIVVQFKNMPRNLYFDNEGSLEPNLLVIRIHPLEGIYLKLNGKRPGTENNVIPISMDFCQSNEININSPEAYEHLLYDCMQGDSTDFTRWDEVKLAWQFVDRIAAAWREDQQPIPAYETGSWGPAEAVQLTEADGFQWWPIAGEKKGEVVWSKNKDLSPITI